MLAMRRSLDLVVGMYAVVTAGGAYVPVDPDHPAERIGYVLESAEPVVVLSTTGGTGSMRGRGLSFAIDTLDLSAYSAAPVTDADRVAPVRPDNTAYVIYTSGSTGRPKGVAVTHRAIVNQIGVDASASTTSLPMMCICRRRRRRSTCRCGVISLPLRGGCAPGGGDAGWSSRSGVSVPGDRRTAV